MIKFFIFILFIIFTLSSSYANNFAYLVIEGQTGKIMASHRADEIRPPASLTKKMTLYLVFEALKNKKISLQTRFPVSKLATKQEPCNLWVKVGETISIENLIYALVTRSANDMSIVIAEGIGGTVENFAVLMNKKAQALGMLHTKFYNPTGLPNKNQVTTAKDMMILARSLHKDFPKEFKYFKAKKFFYNGKPILNHNKMLNSFSGADGIKTGFTCASLFNTSVSAQRIGKDGNPVRIFAVVLGGQTSSSRDKKTAELMEKAFKQLHAIPRMHVTTVIDNVSANNKNKVKKKKLAAISINSKRKEKAKKGNYALAP